ncbi:MAG: hypothetical protein KGI98_12065 [Euryarchaeota archaeon]|nr:hypothetical protein [Euryarchaeota archaeon]MDE1881205.1 hypothetical protein [Euryarchaeota archaeon]
MIGADAIGSPRAADYWFLIEDTQSDVNDYLQRKDPDPVIMDHITRFGSVDFEFLRNWSTVLTPYVENGVPKDEAGIRRWKSVRDTWKIAQRLEFATFVQKYASQPANFIPLKAGLSPSSRIPEFWTVSGPSLVAQMLDAGRFGMISGPPDRGKTDTYGVMCALACDVWNQHQSAGKNSVLSQVTRSIRRGNAEASREVDPFEGADDSPVVEGAPELGMLGAKRFSIIDNVQWGPGPYAKFHTYSSRLSSTLAHISEETIHEGYTWWGMDELAKNMPKMVRAKRENRWLEGSYRTVRKSRCAVWFISQEDDDLARTFRRWCQTEVIKQRRTLALFKVDGIHVYKKLRAVPSCRSLGIPFNTQGHGSFTVDIDTEDLNRHIGDVEASVGYDDPKKAVREINQEIIRYCRDPENRTDRETGDDG